MDKKCAVCDSTFYAKRNTAMFCSANCRVKYNRQVNDDVITPVNETINADKLYDANDLEVDAEGFPLDHTKFTQEQVEAYYTLARFPSRLRYHSAAGGGSGALSPYPMTHPSYQAYTLK